MAAASAAAATARRRTATHPEEIPYDRMISTHFLR
jgi:hypothetical protein